MKTLRDEIKIKGVGLHSGTVSTLRMFPCERAGIYFRASGGVSNIKDAVVSEDVRLTAFTLPNGAAVRTAEHMLAAIAGMGLEAAELELDGEEVPILDGSALPFAEAIKNAGFREVEGAARKRALSTPVYAEEKNGERLLAAFPSTVLSVTYVIDYSGTPVGVQRVKYDITSEIFYNTICRARTFGLTRELDFLKQNGLAKGGTLENALMFDERGLVGGGRLRFPLECVTHKVVDLLGDLTLAGDIPTAHYVAVAAGHSIHGKLVRKLKALP